MIFPGDPNVNQFSSIQPSLCSGSRTKLPELPMEATVSSEDGSKLTK